MLEDFEPTFTRPQAQLRGIPELFRASVSHWLRPKQAAAWSTQRHYRLAVVNVLEGAAPTLMETMFTICKAPGDPDFRPYATRDEAVQGIRELFEAGLAESGDFYIVEQDDAGEVIRVFDVDDELSASASAATGT